MKDGEEKLRKKEIESKRIKEQDELIRVLE